MEHQKFNENLKSAEVSNSCHIYGLLFYDLIYLLFFFIRQSSNQFAYFLIGYKKQSTYNGVVCDYYDCIFVVN